MLCVFVWVIYPKNLQRGFTYQTVDECNDDVLDVDLGRELGASGQERVQTQQMEVVGEHLLIKKKKVDEFVCLCFYVCVHVVGIHRTPE